MSYGSSSRVGGRLRVKCSIGDTRVGMGLSVTLGDVSVGNVPQG